MTGDHCICKPAVERVGRIIDRSRLTSPYDFIFPNGFDTRIRSLIRWLMLMPLHWHPHIEQLQDDNLTAGINLARLVALNARSRILVGKHCSRAGRRCSKRQASWTSSPFTSLQASVSATLRTLARRVHVQTKANSRISRTVSLTRPLLLHRGRRRLQLLSNNNHN